MIIAELRPYPNQRKSTMPWLPSLPAHWSIRRAKTLFREIDRRTLDGRQPLLSLRMHAGLVDHHASGGKIIPPSALVGYKRVLPGELVMNRMRAAIGLFAGATTEGLVSPDYAVFQVEPTVSLPYAVHLFRTPIMGSVFRMESRGLGTGESGFLRLYSDRFGMLPIPLPPPSEQAAIVRFLDHANRRIDRFIRAKKKLIALLNEQKQAIIHRAVTRGIDPNVPMKDSGVPWLGEIPAHWEVRRVKQVARITRGKFSYRPRNDPSLYGGPYPFIQTGAVARANRIINTHTQTLNERGLAVSRLFAQGTLVMTIAANIGDVAILGFDACFPDSIVGFSPMRTVLRDYLYLLFRTMKSEWLREAPVNTQGNLNVERIGAMPLPLPPLAEQDFIVRHVSDGTLPLDAAIDHAVREIAHIREYRTRLIADLVTGQLDVREAVKGLPVEEADGGEPVDAGDEIDEAEIGDIDQDEAA